MKNYYLKKRVVSKIISAGSLTKMLELQIFSEKNLELTPIQFIVLGFISDNDGLYQRQISAFLLKDRPNITRIINILEKKGLVKRVEETSGRKIFKIHATEKGKQLHSLIEPTMLDVRNKVMEGISREEITTCMKVLGKIQNNIIKKVKIQI